jgi:hypothetical protein
MQRIIYLIKEQYPRLYCLQSLRLMVERPVFIQRVVGLSAALVRSSRTLRLIPFPSVDFLLGPVDSPPGWLPRQHNMCSPPTRGRRRPRTHFHLTQNGILIGLLQAS